VWEKAILSELREVKPEDVFGVDAKESEGIATELTGVETRLAQLHHQLMEGDGDVATLTRAARALEAKQAEKAKQLAEARAKESNPPASAFAEGRTLMNAVDLESRLRLRSLLRASIEGIWLLTVARSKDKLCAVTVAFKGGERRNYLVLYRPARYRTPGRWCVISFSPEEVVELEDFDLRNPSEAESWVKELKNFDQQDIDAALAMGYPV
jgi:hypothetical protein